MKIISTVFAILSAFLLMFFSSCDKILDNPDNPVLKKGDTLWVYEIPVSENLYIPDAFMAIGENGDIYFEVRDANGEDDARVYAITKDGKFKWKTEPLDDNDMSGNILGSNIVVGDDGTIYCTSGPYLYSINPSNGESEKLWECPSKLTVNDMEINAYLPLVNLCLNNDGNLVLQSYGTLLQNAAAVYCITPEGQLKWLDIRPDPNAYNLSIGPDGNLYDIALPWDAAAATFIPKLVVSNSENGMFLWDKKAFPDFSENKPVFTSDGDVIFPLIQNDELVRLENDGTSSIWNLKNYGGLYLHSVIDKNDNLFAVIYSSIGTVYIPSDATGEVTSPKNIYIPLFPNIDTKGNLTGVKSMAFPNVIVSSDKDGEELWKYDKVGVNGKSITLSNDEVLYFSGSYEGETGEDRYGIFAIKWDASLEHNGWPRFTHDNRNTSNYNKW